MGKKTLKSHLAEIPAWGLSGITLIVELIFFFILDDATSSRNSTSLIIIAIILAIFIAIACFIICRTHPKSVWYTPLICNALILSSAIFAIPYWTPLLWIWIILGSGFVFSVIGAIVGARIGRRIMTSPE
ncbi:MAG: hypothetical protein ABFS32_23680 [Bacteroidota bacterium]